MKTTKEIIKYGLFIAAISALIMYSNYSSKKSCLRKVKELTFNGVVIKKYIDTKEHNYPIIEIITFDKRIQKVNLSLDYSGLYDYVNTNDTIIKYGGELKVQIHRNCADTTIVLQKRCL